MYGGGGVCQLDPAFHELSSVRGQEAYSLLNDPSSCPRLHACTFCMCTSAAPPRRAACPAQAGAAARWWQPQPRNFPLVVAGYLFYRAVQSANKASEQMDKLDGY